MKKLLLTGAFCVAATGVFAGGLSDPIVAPMIGPDIIVNDAVESAGSDEWILALLVILTIGLGIAGN